MTGGRMNEKKAIRGFTAVKGTNVIVRISLLLPFGRHILFDSLNYNWTAIDKLQQGSDDTVWKVLATYEDCYTARRVIQNTYRLLKRMSGNGVVTYFMPLPDGSDVFSQMEECAQCELLEQCTACHSGLDDVWDWSKPELF